MPPNLQAPPTCHQRPETPPLSCLMCRLSHRRRLMQSKTDSPTVSPPPPPKLLSIAVLIKTHVVIASVPLEFYAPVVFNFLGLPIKY